MFKEILLEATDFKWTRDIEKSANKEFNKCKEFNYILTSDAMGVIPGQPMKIDRVDLDKLKDCFNETRELVRKKFGDKITVYRVDIIDNKIKGKKTLLYSSKKEVQDVWSDFYQKEISQGIRKIVKKTISVDDILAFHVDNYGYKELVVRN